jgi:hypothetical protein
MPDMIERVAMRLAEVYHGKPCSHEYVFGDCTGGRIFVEQARAAIEALREPTEAMEVAGDKASYDYLPRHIAVTAYKAMISAALKEQESH